MAPDAPEQGVAALVVFGPTFCLWSRRDLFRACRRSAAPTDGFSPFRTNCMGPSYQASSDVSPSPVDGGKPNRNWYQVCTTTSLLGMISRLNPVIAGRETGADMDCMYSLKCWNMGAQDIPDQPVSTVFRIAVLLILSGVILLLTPVSTFAQDINNTMLQRVERVTARPLPTLSSLLGQEPSLPAAPTMVIGLLENSNATNPDDWGRAIGWFLMDAAYTAYHELAIVPPYQFHSDARPDTDNDDSSRREQLSRVAARVGARFGLTGIIGVENGRFDLILELLEYPSNRRILIQQKSGELEDISITVQTLAQAIFAEAVAIANPTGRLIAGTITSPEVGELQALAATFGKTRSLPQEERLLAYQKLWQEDPQLGPNALIYLGMLIYSGNTDLR